MGNEPMKGSAKSRMLHCAQEVVRGFRKHNSQACTLPKQMLRAWSGWSLLLQSSQPLNRTTAPPTETVPPQPTAGTGEAAEAVAGGQAQLLMAGKSRSQRQRRLNRERPGTKTLWCFRSKEKSFQRRACAHTSN